MPARAPDVLVRGAGPVGCAATLALHAAGVHALLAPASPIAPPVFRPIVLSYASRLILERLDAWSGLQATPIRAIDVSQMGGFGRTRIEAADAAVESLGYVLDYASLLRLLRRLVSERGLEAPGSCSTARCVVHAEGGSNAQVAKQYAQHALVALATFDRPAQFGAHERFGPEGPLALLPFEGRYAVVWSTRPARAEALAAMPPPAFLVELARAAGTKPGHPLAVQERSVQPLVLRMRGARVGPRSVYIGNAAQTLHPVAGQGLNLGLRDAWDLARNLRDAQDPGAPEILARYASARRLDVHATVRITDFLASAFLGSGAAPRALRALALTALDLLPAPRRFFARRMIYGPSALP